MPRAGGEGEAGPSRLRSGEGGDGTGTRTKNPKQDGVRRKKKRPPADGNGAPTPTLQSTLLNSNPTTSSPIRAGRDRDRMANINPALRPYLAIAPKPVSALSRSALDEAVPLRQAPSWNQAGAGGVVGTVGGALSNAAAEVGGLILPSAFLRSRSSLNLSIGEGSGVAGMASNGRSGGQGNGEGSDVAQGQATAQAQNAPPARMYASGLVAPPMIVPAGSSAAMRQAQSQGRNGVVVPQQPSQSDNRRDRAGPSRRRDRTARVDHANPAEGRRRSTEDLRRQHPNNSSTSLTLLPGSSTLVRIPEDGPGPNTTSASAAPAQQGPAAAANRRRRRGDEQLRRRPTVTSREEGRALGLSRGASMRRVNVWDEVSNVDEGDMGEPPPPFPFPPSSGASPTAATATAAAAAGASNPSRAVDQAGEEGDAPPAFVSGSGHGAGGESANGPSAPEPPRSPPPTFAQAMGLEPLPHSTATPSLAPASDQTMSRRPSTARSVRTTRSSSPVSTEYASAPSSPIASDAETISGSDGERDSSNQASAERDAWEEDVRLGFGLEERVRREMSRRRRRGDNDNVDVGEIGDPVQGRVDTAGPVQLEIATPASAPTTELEQQVHAVEHSEQAHQDGNGEPSRPAIVTRDSSTPRAVSRILDEPVLAATGKEDGPERSLSLLKEPATSPVADIPAPSPSEDTGPDSATGSVSPAQAGMLQDLAKDRDEEHVDLASHVESGPSAALQPQESPQETPAESLIVGTPLPSADDPVSSVPARKLTRGKAIRRSSSGFGLQMTATGSAPTSPAPDANTNSPRIGMGSRRRSSQQIISAIPQESPSLDQTSPPSSSPRQPLFGETGFDWRPASIHLGQNSAPAGGSLADDATGSSGAARVTVPLSSPSLGIPSGSKARMAQRSSVDFAAVGPGRRIGDKSAPIDTAPATAIATEDSDAPRIAHRASVASSSGSRFHEMPRRSTEGDILPHRQAAMKRRELFTAVSPPETASMSGPSRISPVSPSSPPKLQLLDHFPSGPLVDFSDFMVSTSPPESGGSGLVNGKGKARADGAGSSTSTAASTMTTSGSHRSRPLMPLPPELVALFHEEIPEELEDAESDGNEDDGEQKQEDKEDQLADDKVAGKTTDPELREEAAQVAEIEDAVGEMIRSGSSSWSSRTVRPETVPVDPPAPNTGVNRQMQTQPPQLSINTDKILPSLPDHSASLSGVTTMPTMADMVPRRAPPPPPLSQNPLKRHLVSTTVGANLAPRRSIIRTADTPVTPRPIRQFGANGGGAAPPMRRPPPPPPRPVSQHLQDALGGARIAEQRLDASGGPDQGNALSSNPAVSGASAGPRPERDAPVSPTMRDPPGLPSGRASRGTMVGTTDSSVISAAHASMTRPQASINTTQTPPALPPRPPIPRPSYDRNDSLVSFASAESSSSGPTTLSRIPPVPVYKPPPMPPPAIRPRGPRPRPPPIPPRPWIQVVTNSVEFPAEENSVTREVSRPAAERTQSDNSVRTMPVRQQDSPASVSTVRAPTRRSTSEMDLRGIASASPENAAQAPRSPRSPRAASRQASMEYTDLDVLVSRLEGSGREYEGFSQISAFLGPGKIPAASANAISTLLPGLVSVDSRRVTKDGKVKLKLSLLGVRVAKCPICLAQFKKDERGVILPECGHHAHEACARKWFKEDGRCFVCREPLAEEQEQGREGEGRGSRGSRMVEGVV